MATNEGNADRVIRVVLAVVAAIIAVAVGAGSVLGVILWIVAGILLVTGLAGFCPLYRMLGINTCPLKHSS